MPTISSKVSQKEVEAITEYANICGETVSNLIRKILLRNATLADSFDSDDGGYGIQMAIPEGISSEEEDKLIEANYNRIRRILGLKSIQLTLTSS